MRRRYLVKMVTSWPEWTGTVWAYGRKHLASAEALFERREVEVSPGSYSALLLIDRPKTRSKRQACSAGKCVYATEVAVFPGRRLCDATVSSRSHRDYRRPPPLTRIKQKALAGRRPPH